MDDELDGVDIVGDNDELDLAFLNECGHVVQAELQVVGLRGLCGTSSLGFLLETGLLILLGLRRVLS
jgi:hypothetical protein